MLDAIRAYEVLYAKDEHAARYIENFSRPEEIARISAKPTVAPSPGVRTAVSADAAENSDEIAAAIHKGLGEPVRQAVKALLQTQEPEQIINERLIPALDAVGDDFEKGKLFLPQMIQSRRRALRRSKTSLPPIPRRRESPLPSSSGASCWPPSTAMCTTSAKTSSR